MTLLSDRQLLSRYTSHRDHDAFAAIVRRYIAMVRSAAMRQVRESSTADDVTQAVMIVLARRASEIPTGVSLASWLFTVTHHIARNAQRSARRRMHHERFAAMQRRESSRSTSTTMATDLNDILDEGIARLPEFERGGVVLYYLNHCSHEEVGQAMGISAEAARKRVRRGLERLRAFFDGRGIETSGTAVAAALSVRTRGALSSDFVTSTINVALFSALQIGAPVSRAALLAHGLKFGAASIASKVAAVGIVLLTVLGGVAVARHSALRVASVAPTSQPTTQPTTQPDRFAVDVAKDIRIEFLGISEFPGNADGWFSFAGEPIALPDPKLADNKINTDASPNRQLAIVLRTPSDAAWSVNIEGATTMSISLDNAARGGKLCRARFALEDGRESFGLVFSLATKSWTTAATFDAPAEEADVDGGELGTLHVFPAKHNDRWGTHVDIHYSDRPMIARLIATDTAGREHPHKMMNTDNVGPGVRQAMFIFDLAPEQIRSLRLETREFDKEVRVSDISLEANHRTQPKIEVSDVKPR